METEIELYFSQKTGDLPLLPVQVMKLAIAYDRIWAESGRRDWYLKID